MLLRESFRRKSGSRISHIKGSTERLVAIHLMFNDRAPYYAFSVKGGMTLLSNWHRFRFGVDSKWSVSCAVKSSCDFVITCCVVRSVIHHTSVSYIRSLLMYALNAYVNADVGVHTCIHADVKPYLTEPYSPEDPSTTSNKTNWAFNGFLEKKVELEFKTNKHPEDVAHMSPPRSAPSAPRARRAPLSTIVLLYYLL